MQKNISARAINNNKKNTPFYHKENIIIIYNKTIKLYCIIELIIIFTENKNDP